MFTLIVKAKVESFKMKPECCLYFETEILSTAAVDINDMAGVLTNAIISC